MLSNEEYIRELEVTFATVGWQLLTKEWEDRIKILGNAALDPNLCRNWDDVVAGRAMAATLSEFVNLPDYIASLKE